MVKESRCSDIACLESGTECCFFTDTCMSKEDCAKVMIEGCGCDSSGAACKTTRQECTRLAKDKYQELLKKDPNDNGICSGWKHFWLIDNACNPPGDDWNWCADSKKPSVDTSSSEYTDAVNLENKYLLTQKHENLLNVFEYAFPGTVNFCNCKCVDKH